MKKIISIISIFLFFGALAQEKTASLQTVLVEMKNGEQYTGKIIDKTETQLVLETENGTFNLNLSKIENIDEKAGHPDFGFANPYARNYGIGPTAIPEKRKQLSYQNIFGTLNFLNFGLTDNVSVSLGFDVLSSMFSQAPTFFLTTKAGFKINDKSYIGGGLTLTGFGAAYSREYINLGYGVYTFGTPETNFTTGIAYGISEGKWLDYPPVMLAGTHRIWKYFSVFSENYLYPDRYIGYLIAGVQGFRIMFEKHAIDIGSLFLAGPSEFLPNFAPYLSYHYIF